MRVTRERGQPHRKRAPRPLGWVLLTLAMAACNTDDARTLKKEPPPVEQQPSATDGEDGGIDAGPFVEHRVARGQTLWEIAKAYGTSVDTLMEANDMGPEDIRRVREGAVLRVPGVREAREVLSAEERARRRREALPEPTDGAYHFMAAGETLWDLARTYDKSVDDIMARNELGDDDAASLREGTPVLIPGVRPADIKKVDKTKPQKTRGIRHTVAAGETVWDLSNAFQVSVAEIMAANRLSSEEVTLLREGQKLFIPGVDKDRRGKVRRPQSPRQRRAQAAARRLGLGTRQAASKLLGGRVDPRWTRAAGGSRAPGTLRWPVTNGWYVRGYGSGDAGYHLAVDIMGEIGWNVRAAAPGIVAYSGSEVRGYGNMVLVVHPGGWVTMYAHNSTNFVVAGEKVPRGGILAEVGSTGISRGPHVHFELIHDRKNCDPAPLFRPGVRHRNGKRSPIKPVTWRDPKRRPDAIDCAPRRRHPQSRWVVNE